MVDSNITIIHKLLIYVLSPKYLFKMIIGSVCVCVCVCVFVHMWVCVCFHLYAYTHAYRIDKQKTKIINLNHISCTLFCITQTPHHHTHTNTHLYIQIQHICVASLTTIMIISHYKCNYDHLPVMFVLISVKEIILSK